MKKLLTICSLLLCFGSWAQYPAVTIPGSEARTITSAIVKGQEYVLHISLPGGYVQSDQKKYPVVYLMDSQWDFPLVSAIYGEQYYDGFIPGLIIVGVTWGGAHPNPDSLRARDYTPTHENSVPQSGGADAFLSFMKDELFPFVEKNYRADPDQRILMGCSLGGLFTLYALFTHTDMFHGYAAASPAVGWGREALYHYEKNFASRKPVHPVRVYMTVGDVERGRPVFEKMASMMANREYPLVSLQSKVLVNTGHSGTKAETYTRGLQYIFERPRLMLSSDMLDRYAGSYRTPNGFQFEIKKEDQGLTLHFGPNTRYQLFAAGEADFYSVSEFFKIHFKTDAGEVTGFQLDRYGNSVFMTKSK